MINSKIINVIIAIILCLILCSLTKKIITKMIVIKSSKVSYKRQKTIVNLMSNIIRAFIVFITITIVLESFGVDTKSLIASLGVFSLVLGFALQDLMKDLISGISIILEGQLNIGDWISIGDFKGEVIHTGLRITKLRAYTGEIKIFSNRNIFELTNYSQNQTTGIIDVEVDYKSDLKKVASTLLQISEIYKNDNRVKNIECLGIEDFLDNGIKYRLVFKSNYLDSKVLARQIKGNIIELFRENDIEIPYPQVVVHNGL